jgi:sugar phosphate isomerase/epimerase
MWTLGLSTGIGYRHRIEDTLEPIREAGITTIEVSTAPQHLDLFHHGSLRALAGQIRDAGLVVHALHAPFGHDVNITSPDPGQREASFVRLTRAAEALALLGGRLYVMHPGGEDQRWVWERERRMALAAEGLRRMAGLCSERGLELVVETPLPHLLGGQPDDFAWILAQLPGEGVGVCIDTSHCSLGGFLFDVLGRFAPRLVHLQASDNRGATDDHLPPGEGVIDWTRCREALEAADYRGVFMLEVSGDGDVGEHVRRAVEGARRVMDGALASPSGKKSASGPHRAHS